MTVRIQALAVSLTVSTVHHAYYIEFAVAINQRGAPKNGVNDLSLTAQEENGMATRWEVSSHTEV